MRGEKVNSPIYYYIYNTSAYLYEQLVFVFRVFIIRPMLAKKAIYA